MGIFIRLHASSGLHVVNPATIETLTERTTPGCGVGAPPVSEQRDRTLLRFTSGETLLVHETVQDIQTLIEKAQASR